MYTFQLFAALLPSAFLALSTAGLAVPGSPENMLAKRCTTRTGFVAVRNAPAPALARFFDNGNGKISETSGKFGLTHWQSQAGVFKGTDCGDGEPIEFTCQVGCLAWVVLHAPGNRRAHWIRT